MRDTDRKGQNHTNPARLRPHAKWAQQLIALSRCQLVGMEREHVEAHLEACPACKEAYLVYCAISSLMHQKAPPAMPPGLPPKLQELKEQVLAEDAEFARGRAALSAKSGRQGEASQPVTARKPAPRPPSREKPPKKQSAKARGKASSKQDTAAVGAGVENAGQPSRQNTWGGK
jgi:hypothetical protein